jgi:hypothetical protein
MSTNATSGQETSDCTGLKTTVCANGVINVKRPQSDRAHSTFVDADGDVLRCSCKGHKFNGHCVHQDEIEKRPLVRSSAAAAAAETSQQVATDGGTREVAKSHTSAPETTGNRPQADQWDQPVEHFDDAAVGAGERRQCQACGTRFEVALVAATADSWAERWEEFYRCQNCNAGGSFRVDESDEDRPREARRTWTGMMAYPDD